ncbi:MAG: hypothetical protein SVP26_07730 [Chloroflexota bacterium]|nr:hypothetical protein [Chloroflexota bacterium]
MARNPRKRDEKRRRHARRPRRSEVHQMEHGSFLVVALLHGPLTREQLIDRFLRVGRHFGVPVPRAGTDARASLLNEVEHDLDRLTSMGFVEVDEQGAYLLTDRGRKEAEEADR